MARKPRIEFHGALFHVIARGNQKRRTFLIAKDYDDYLDRLWKYHEKFSFVLYAYCLMPNHVHLLIEMRGTPLSRIMQAIQFAYTQSFNRRHRTVGHLFQGRYKAILCQRDEYLLELIRYIHLNPVRARIVKRPGDYRWSSHRGLVGLEKKPLSDVDAVLSQFGKRRKDAAKRYESFVMDAIASGHRDDLYQLKDQRILGEDDFVADALEKGKDDSGLLGFYDVSLDEVIDAVAREWEIARKDIVAPTRDRPGSFARGVVAYLAKKIAGISMREVGRHLSKKESAMARRFRAIEDMIAMDRGLKRRLKKAWDTLTAGRPMRFK